MLSATLIVRNEASEIEACLDTLAEFDEIIVCDTGSVDNTVDKVREWSLANRSVHLIINTGFRWIDDFSAARNFAAGMASEEWVLHIDADMRLEKGGYAKLRAACEAAKGDTMAITQRSDVGAWSNRRVLCHRHGAARFVGAIHEALDTDHGDTADVVITYGYSASHELDPGRNLRILTREVGKAKTPRLLYYYAEELYRAGRAVEALHAFGECASTTRWACERADAFLYIARIEWSMHHGDAARQACLLSLGNAPDCREALLFMAEMCNAPEAAVWTRYADTATNTGCLFIRSPHSPLTN